MSVYRDKYVDLVYDIEEYLKKIQHTQAKLKEHQAIIGYLEPELEAELEINDSTIMVLKRMIKDN